MVCPAGLIVGCCFGGFGDVNAEIWQNYFSLEVQAGSFYMLKHVTALSLFR